MAQSGTDEQNVNETENVFEMVCDFFEKNGCNYNKDEENLSAGCVVHGKDIDMSFSFHVEESPKRIQLISQLPFATKEDKRLDVAMAANEINMHLMAGSFDFDINNGRIMFRVTNSYFATPISEEAISDMFSLAYKFVKEYNDKIFRISNDDMTIDEFIDLFKGGD